MSARIALATSAEFPDLDEDGPVLRAALSGRGLAAEPAVWTDARVDWSSYDLVVVRSTWDYAPRRDEFLAWADRVGAATRLVNAPDVLRWNTDKAYLRDLAAAGLPVVDTSWLEPGDEVVLPEQGEYVVKPAVSAGSKDTNRYLAAEHGDRAARHARDLLAAGRAVMVQPYLPAVDTYGETALLFFAGEFSHAVRKGPMLQPVMDFVAGAFQVERIAPRVPSDAEREVAERVLDALRFDRHALAYARVDLVPGVDSAPTLLELELTEPSMFLVHDEAAGHRAADRFAAALASLTEGAHP